MEKKKFKAISVDKLDEQTILQIREWRNQEFVRKTCLQQHEISVEEHLDFIDKIKADENRQLYVFYLDNEPFAVYHYIVNLDKNEVTSSIYLVSEDFQAMGYGSILTYAVNYIEACCLNVGYINDVILDTNKEALSFVKESDLTDTSYIVVNERRIVVNHYRSKIEKYNDQSRLARIVSEIVDINTIRNKNMYKYN